MLKRCIRIILFLFLTVFQLSYGSFHNDKKATDFELLIFAQQWPMSFCAVQNDMVPSHNCVLLNKLEWTIHGIWPTRYHKLSSKLGPLFCNKTLHLNESVLYPISSELEIKWRNVHNNTHFLFWKHEWEKHGSCAIEIPELNTQLKYFQKGLDLQNKYDMTRVLAIAGILPGQNYELQKIIDGVEQILGKTVQIKCLKNEKIQKSYLLEIRICLDKVFKLTDCNKISHFSHKCDHSMPVNYPGITLTSRSNGIESI